MMLEIQRLWKKLGSPVKSHRWGRATAIFCCVFLLYLYIPSPYFINSMNIYICEFKYQIGIIFYVHFYKLLFM